MLNKKSTKRSVENSNKLLLTNNNPDYKVLASKTGYTDEAGATLIQLIESTKDKKQYVVITMGNSDYQNRFNEPSRIASWTAKNNSTAQVAKNTN
jgi:D-alanyl-D-alanine carboxypeptidase